ANKPVVKMHLPDSYRQVERNSKGGRTRKESRQNQQAAQQLRKGGNITEPSRQAHAGDGVNGLIQPSKNLLIAVYHHNAPQRQPNYQQAKGLQPIQIAQANSSQELTRITQLW